MNADAGAALGWAPLAYSLHPVIREGLKLAAWAAMFFLTLNLLRDRRRIDILICSLIAMAMLQSIYSVYAIFGKTASIWWWQRPCW